MRGLFAKIFVAFFLTVVLLGVLLEITAMRNEMRRVQAILQPLAAESALRIADAYEQRGGEAMVEEIRNLPLPAVLIDASSQPLGEVPPRLAPAVARIKETSAREPLSSFVVMEGYALQPAQSSSGRAYVLAIGLPHERWSAILNTMDQYPALRLSILGVVAGLVCWLLARHITRPLVRLRAVAGRMADGDLEARAGRTLSVRHDEIGALGRDFDSMAERLAALVASERRLLADVSHELRSPLARLTVALGLARQHLARDGAALGADLDRIALEADRLDRLIGQSLALSRLETGVESGPRESFDLTNLVQQTAADADYEARGTNRRVEVTFADACTMIGAADLVRSAIENVVRNAIRYAPEGSTVTIELRCHDSGDAREATLHVRDRGPGVPPTMLSEIFKPFRRGRESSQGAGTGLGLAIADKVVRLHAGRIRAHNATEGGLDVEIALPVSS